MRSSQAAHSHVLHAISDARECNGMVFLRPFQVVAKRACQGLQCRRIEPYRLGSGCIRGSRSLQLLSTKSSWRKLQAHRGRWVFAADSLVSSCLLKACKEVLVRTPLVA